MTDHATPIGDDPLTPCCQRTPFELPLTDRLTADPDQVTCGRNTQPGDHPLTRLEQIVAAVERDLLIRYAEQFAAPTPELARDTSGRYLLLDAYAALVTGRAARDQLAAALIAHPISAAQADQLNRRGLLP